MTPPGFGEIKEALEWAPRHLFARKHFTQDLERPMTPATAREEIGTRLKALLQSQPEIQVDVNALTEDTPFEEVGFDSLSILDFMYEMEEVFDIRLEVKELLAMDTVGDLIGHLQKKMA